MQKLKSAVALAAFGIAASGPGVGTAHAVFYLQCPRDLKATWAGAAFGRTNEFYGPMTTSYIVLPQKDTHLGCETTPAVPEVITQVVQLSPGAIPALCGGRAKITGFGVVFGGVPPFGGFVFESGRIDAIPTYNQATGRCQLDLPLDNLFMVEVVSPACDLLAAEPDWWRCQNNTNPVSALFEDGGERFAGVRAGSTRSASLLSSYDAFANERLTITSLLFPNGAGATLAVQ